MLKSCFICILELFVVVLLQINDWLIDVWKVLFILGCDQWCPLFNALICAVTISEGADDWQHSIIGMEYFAPNGYWHEEIERTRGILTLRHHRLIGRWRLLTQKDYWPWFSHRRLLTAERERETESASNAHMSMSLNSSFRISRTWQVSEFCGVNLPKAAKRFFSIIVQPSSSVIVLPPSVRPSFSRGHLSRVGPSNGSPLLGLPLAEPS